MQPVLWLMTVAWSQASPNDLRRAPPTGWVDLEVVVTDLRVDARYHMDDNFTGRQLPGYGVAGAWLLEAPGMALARVQAELLGQGYSLYVYDAYRPRRATDAMVAWAYRSGNAQLVTQGYISPTSFHNRGMAIDLGLVRLADGEVVDMGSAFDDLSPASHTANATGDAAVMRKLLKTAMEHHGWKNYWREWWHFSWPAAGMPERRDVPYACFEVDEGQWVAPQGWERAGWVQPQSWGTAPCGDAPSAGATP